MRLCQALIRNYRGIQESRLNFEDLTVLIGENGCGKSSLLNALEACLGRRTPPAGFEFEARDLFCDEVHGCPPEGIEIVLRFGEESRTEASLLKPLREAGLVNMAGQLDFEFKVRARPSGDHFEVKWEIGREDRWHKNPELLQSLRQASPMVRIRCGGIPVVGKGEDEDTLLTQVRAAFHSVMESKDPPPDLLQEVISHLGDFFAKFHKPDHATSLKERLEAPMQSSSEVGWIMRHLRGSGVQSLALLSMAAVFIEAQGPGPLEEGSRPIITLEDPEVHLHPLASRTVWSLLAPISAQKLITTNSPDLLAAGPLGSLRRMVRSRRGKVQVFGPNPAQFDQRALRRAAYHVRIRRGASLFMRVWLLVEGESEFWLLNEVARVCGYELAHEGVACVEFAQSGLSVVIQLAAALGIHWHVLCDGDKAGDNYRAEAERLKALGPGRAFQLRERDLEECLWKHGYESVFRREAGMPKSHGNRDGRERVIKQAVRNTSKPHLALVIADEMRKRGPDGAPAPLRKLVEQVVKQARA